MAFDALQDRWERTAPRERKLVFLLALTFVFCIVAWVVMTVSRGLDAIEERNRIARNAISALESYRAGAGGAGGAGDHVVIPPQPIELSSYVDEIVREVGAQSPAYPSPKTSEHGKIVESSMRVTLKDMTVVQVKDLLEKIETKSPVVVTRELKVKKNFRDREKLDVDLVISTYHEPGAAQPAAEPAAGGEGGGDAGKEPR
jgi:hypothetical protein